MNIPCLFRTWPYSCIWLRNIDIFGAGTWAYRSWYGFRLGYHGSTKTIREAAKNKEESISERLVQAIEGERERKHKAPENKKQGKETKNTKNKFGAPQKEKGKCPAPKKEKKQRNSKRKKRKKKKAWKEKKKEVTQLNSKKKKAWRKEKE